jgi:hypothetical protein
MAKKIILIVCGAFALLIALPLLAVGFGLLAVGGRSGTLQSGYHQVSTSSTAFVASPSDVRGSGDAALQVGGASLLVSGQGSGRPLFIGVGPASQVTDYLAGSSYDTVTDIGFSPFKVSSTHVDGTARPAAPIDQSFWVAEATGTAPELSWKVTGGDYLLVAMNADASPGVAFQVRVGISASVLFGTALGFTIGGAVLLLLGLALLVWGIRAKRTRPAYPGGYPYPPGPTAYPGGQAPYPGGQAPYPGGPAPYPGGPAPYPGGPGSPYPGAPGAAHPPPGAPVAGPYAQYPPPDPTFEAMPARPAEPPPGPPDANPPDAPGATDAAGERDAPGEPGAPRWPWEPGGPGGAPR